MRDGNTDQRGLRGIRGSLSVCVYLCVCVCISVCVCVCVGERKGQAGMCLFKYLFLCECVWCMYCSHTIYTYFSNCRYVCVQVCVCGKENMVE